MPLTDSTHVGLIDLALKFVQFVMAVLVGPALWALVRRLGAIRDHLATLNGRLGVAEKTISDNKALVDERHHENKDVMREIKDRLSEACKYPYCPTGQQPWRGEERRKRNHRLESE